MRFSWRLAACAAIAAFGFAPGAWAQGCVLCYTSLASSGPTAMHAFQMAMFALLIPALLLFLSVFLLIFRRARVRPQSKPMPRKAGSGLFSPNAKPLEGRA